MDFEFLEGLCLDEITLVNTYVASSSLYPIKNRGRAHCGMLLTLQGTETYHFHDKSITARPGTVLFIPRKEQYGIDLEGERSVVVCIDFELTGNSSFRPFLIKVGNVSDLKTLFADAEKEWKRKKVGFAIACKASFYKIISMLVRWDHYHLNTEGYQKIADAVDYLHRHYLENSFRLSSLAEIADMSGRYFEILFYNEFKMTPKEYVLSLKLSYAKELLSNEKTSVTDVALFLGFSDIYYFSKLFKAKTGFSPSEYRKIVRNEKI